MSEYQIGSVSFEPEGISVQYLEVPNDIRVRGKLVRQHQLQISARHDDYREEIEALHRRVQRLLTDVLEDFEQSEPYVPEPDDQDEDEDDEKGMGE